MALNPHIAVIKCVKDLCCELAVKVHGKYSTVPVSADICCPITVIRRLTSSNWYQTSDDSYDSCLEERHKKKH